MIGSVGIEDCASTPLSRRVVPARARRVSLHVTTIGAGGGVGVGVGVAVGRGVGVAGLGVEVGGKGVAVGGTGVAVGGPGVGVAVGIVDVGVGRGVGVGVRVGGIGPGVIETTGGAEDPYPLPAMIGSVKFEGSPRPIAFSAITRNAYISAGTRSGSTTE